MIEKLAKALLVLPGGQIDDMGHARYVARAALEAIREPGEEMLSAVSAGSRDRFGGETEPA